MQRDLTWVVDERKFCERLIDEFLVVTSSEAALGGIDVKTLVKDRLLQPFDTLTNMYEFSKAQLETLETQIKVIHYNFEQARNKLFKIEAEKCVLEEKLKEAETTLQKYRDIDITIEAAKVANVARVAGDVDDCN